ncbi:hypothetical protein, partial [Aphanizomenon sp. FACHB-1401]|uniref:hypothetical protein n=1 Tax=Aphanizomenon sp. FACHB-1401 TaxID=2692774 RepID=UPI001A7E3E26
YISRICCCHIYLNYFLFFPSLKFTIFVPLLISNCCKYRILQEDKPTIIGVLSKGSVVSEMEVDNSYYSELVGALLHHGGRMINEGHLDW